MELAHEWQNRKCVDVFRGQVFPWPPNSSLSRWRSSLSEGKALSAAPALTRFLTWASRNPEFAAFAEDETKLTAIAQHFGIATDYVDFTPSPEIAYLFSRDRSGESSYDSEDSCIYCLSLTQMHDWFNSLTREEAMASQIYPIYVEFPELHRLQAQMGLFLHGPGEWYRRFEPDCILFPRQPRLDDSERLTLYPPTSKLEEDLQAFAQSNDTVEWAEFIERIGGQVVHMAPPSTSVRDTCFLSPPPIATQWQKHEQNVWAFGRYSEYAQPYTIRWPLQTVKMGNVMFAAALRHQLKELLTERQQLRNISLKFEVPAGDGTIGMSEALGISEALTRAWNGMIAFPYSHEELLECFERIVFLGSSGITSRNSDISAKLERMLSQPVENKNRWIKIFLESHVGASSEALCSFGELAEALRPDLPKFLSPSGRALAFTEPLEFIRQVRDPPLIFDFDSLRRLFIDNLIPTQALLRRLDQPIILSPVQVMDFWPDPD